MTNFSITNGAPKNINLGADDKSVKIIPPSPVMVPQHCPKIYFFGQEGPTKPVLMGSDSYVPYYGARTFDQLDTFFNHQTELAVLMGKNANAVVMERVVPADNTVKANVAVYIDIIEDELPNYIRDSYGTIKVDPSTNQYMVNTVTPTISGYRVKYISESSETAVSKGLLTTKNGTMTSSGGHRSTMYPMFELVASELGSSYCNTGITLSTPSVGNYDDSLMSTTKYFHYVLSVFKRVNTFSTGYPTRNTLTSLQENVVLKNKAVNQYAMRTDIETGLRSWSNLTNVDLDRIYPDFEPMYFYHTFFDDVLGLLYAKEKTHIDVGLVEWADGITVSPTTWFDFSEDLFDNEKGLLNVLTGKSSKNVQYFTVKLDSGAATLTGTQKEVYFNGTTPIYMENGSDGTMNNETFEEAVCLAMDNYSDANGPYINTVLNPETFFYDTGFTQDTRDQLYKFITKRNNTMLILGTHDNKTGEKVATIDQLLGVITATVNTMSLAPESLVFGTTATRAVIVPGSGLSTNVGDLDRKSTTFELANKASKLMGAANGIWKNEYMFDSGTAADFTHLTDIEPNDLSYSLAKYIYGQGVVAIGPSKLGGISKFTALSTVNANPSSALHGFFTVCAYCHSNTVADRVHLEYTGNMTLTEATFPVEVSKRFNELINGAFGNSSVVNVTGECVIDSYDKARGFSWHLVVTIGANVMKTVMITETRIYRMEDLPVK